MPPAEPTPNDIAAVETAISGQPPAAPPQAPPAAPPAPATPPQPTPQPQQPAAQPPAAPAAQPVPTGQPVDPFAAIAAPPAEPAAPAAPAPQPTEPAQPAPQPAQPAAPAAPAEPTPAAESYQSYEDYMKSVTEGLPEVPAQPDPSQVNPDDPETIKKFFDDLMSNAEKRFEANYARKTAIQTTERGLWDKAFEKYGSLRTNKKARDLVHSVRMGYFQRGTAITPTQAADILLESMGGQYRQGVADSAVVTTIENVQPTGGGTGQPVETTLDKDQTLKAVQDGGETALAEILDAEIKAGKL